MPYNTNTRLLLNFDGSNGATTTTDTSSFARSVTLGGTSEISNAQGKFSTNSLILGDPAGSGSVGDVTVDSPAGIFTSSTSSGKRIDCWFYRENNSPWGNHPIVSITFQNGDTFMVWRSVTAYEVEVASFNTNGDYTYVTYTDYNGYQTWVHLRIYVSGDTIVVGLDGAEIISQTEASNTDLWVGSSGNPITEFRIGGWPSSFSQDSNVFARGYFDAYEVLEGDTSWTGGSYTVPTAAPVDYSGGGSDVNVALTGQAFSHSQGDVGASRSIPVAGQGFVLAQGVLSADGSVSVAISGQLLATAQGGMQPSAVVSQVGQSFAFSQGTTTATYPPPYNTNTRLLLNFGETNGSTTTADTSSQGRAVTITNAGSVSSADGKFSTNSLKLGNPGGTSDYGQVSVDSPSWVFAAARTDPKRFDLFFKTTEANTSNYSQMIFNLHYDDYKMLRCYVQNGVVSLMLNLGSGSEHFVEIITGTLSNWYGDWAHLRVYAEDTEMVLGLNGAEAGRMTGSLPAWPGTGSNTLTHIWFGHMHLGGNTQYFRGYMDCIEITEGDSTWTGGSYTIPALPPTDSASAELFGQGANTTDTTSVGVAVFPDAITASGANTVEAISGAGVGGDTDNNPDLFTTLMLHCNLSGLLKDDSLYAADATSVGTISSYTTPPVTGDAAILFPYAMDAFVIATRGRGLFFDSASDKIIDFIIRPSAGVSAVAPIFAVSFPVTAYAGGSSYISLALNTTTGKLDLTARTPTTSVNNLETASVVTLDQRNNIRLAVIDDDIYLCVNGTQELVASSVFGDDVWPTSVPASYFYIGCFNGTLDEVRVQEGSVANHGYSGGNYTLDGTEWYPNQTLGAGSNTLDALSSVGDGFLLPEILGVGDFALAGTFSEGLAHVGIFVEGGADVVLDGAASVGDGVVHPILFAAGANSTDAITALCQVVLSWAGTGASVVLDISSSGAGSVSDFLVGVGEYFSSVSSAGNGTVTITGSGEVLAEVFSLADGLINAYMAGVSEASVSSVGNGFIDKEISDFNSVAFVTSVSDGIVFSGAEVMSIIHDIVSSGVGAVEIAGGGASGTEVLTYQGIAPVMDGSLVMQIVSRTVHEPIFIGAR